jgi:hypothetical protein
MENHPIPQDVTGFKFRLIGSITVKQFLYLLGAGAIALVFYLLPIPIFLKIPLMLICAGVGLSLAFIPIDGRPMDKMIYNFIKALPSENQYIYHKQGVEMPYFSFTPPMRATVKSVNRGEGELNKKTILFNQLNRAYFKPDQEEQTAVANISNLFQEGDSPTQGFVNRVANADETPQVQENIYPSTPVHSSISPAETLSKPHAAASFTPVKNSQDLQEDKKVDKVKVVSSPPPPPQPAPQAQSLDPAITPVPANGIDTPNIIQGLVVDPRGKTLPHIIVEIIDGNGTPLRTFRTNQNGTFMAATPMPNGTYTIHLEDTLKKQEFSDVIVSLNGTIIQPVTIKSIDQREKLRQELFGTQTMNS